MRKKFIDLSVPIESVPSEPFKPSIIHHDHKSGAEVMKGIFGCTDADLPEGHGWANDTLTLITHAGTHLDAPWHFYPSTEKNKKSPTIDEIPLEWCFGKGVVLDFTYKKDGELITAEDMELAVQKINYEIKQRDIVLIMTGVDKYWGTEEYFNRGCGMGRESTLWLLDRGVKITGTDAWGWDRPFKYIKEEFAKTKNRDIIWEGHFVGKAREYCHLEKLTNLDKLPPFGFTVICFPIKIKSASAAWTRVVAILEERGENMNTPKKILVVDDETNIRTLYKDELEDEGYSIILASSGEEAFEILEKEHIDLVTLDIKMPGISGLEVLRKIKEKQKGLPVILLSAYDTYKQDFTSWAAEDYVVKSFDLAELKEKIKKYLGAWEKTE